MKKSKLLVNGITAAIILAAPAFLCYYIYTGFYEDKYIAEGSLLYYLHVDSELVKDFAGKFKLRDIEYYYSCGDGSAPAADGVRGKVPGTTEEIQESIRVYLLKQGYTWDSNLEAYVSRNSSPVVWVNIKGENSATVTVFFKELYP